MENPDYKALLLSLIRSLGLADHMGDVAEDVQKVLADMGEDIAWDDLGDLGEKLRKRGIKTVWGTN